MFVFISAESLHQWNPCSGASEVAEVTELMLKYQNINYTERTEYAPYYDTSVGVAFSILSVLGEQTMSLVYLCLPSK